MRATYLYIHTRTRHSANSRARSNTEILPIELSKPQHSAAFRDTGLSVTVSTLCRWWHCADGDHDHRLVDRPTYSRSRDTAPDSKNAASMPARKRRHSNVLNSRRSCSCLRATVMRTSECGSSSKSSIAGNATHRSHQPAILGWRRRQHLPFQTCKRSCTI